MKAATQTNTDWETRTDSHTLLMCVYSQAGGSLCVKGQPGLHIKVQHNQCYKNNLSQNNNNNKKQATKQKNPCGYP